MRVWRIVAPLLLLAGCRGLLDVDGAQRVAYGFVAALSAGDTDGAYRWLALEWQRELDQQKFETFVRNGSLVGAKIDRPVWRGTQNNVSKFSVVVSTPEGLMTVELFLMR